MENNLKPFDPEAAKRGEKVVTRDGRPARIVCWDLDGIHGESIVALVQCDYGSEHVLTFYKDGKIEMKGDSPNDLFMAPVKHKGYVVVFKENSYFTPGVVVFSTKESAEEHCKEDGGLSVAKIEWEE